MKRTDWLKLIQLSRKNWRSILIGSSGARKGSPHHEGSWDHHLLNSNLFTSSDKDIIDELEAIDEWLEWAQEDLTKRQPIHKNKTILGGGAITLLGVAGIWVPVLGIAATGAGVFLFGYDLRRSQIRERVLAELEEGIVRISERRRRINLELIRRANANDLEAPALEIEQEALTDEASASKGFFASTNED